jgi:hypothetical protein
MPDLAIGVPAARGVEIYLTNVAIVVSKAPTASRGVWRIVPGRTADMQERWNLDRFTITRDRPPRATQAIPTTTARRCACKSTRLPTHVVGLQFRRAGRP